MIVRVPEVAVSVCVSDSVEEVSSLPVEVLVPVEVLREVVVIAEVLLPELVAELLALLALLALVVVVVRLLVLLTEVSVLGLTLELATTDP